MPSTRRTGFLHMLEITRVSAEPIFADEKRHLRVLHETAADDSSSHRVSRAESRETANNSGHGRIDTINALH